MSTSSRVLLVAAAVLGGCLWFGSKGFIPPAEPSPADEFAISGPFTHGNLSVFLLHGPDAERPRPVLGLDEALARKCAIVYETDSVNELAVENTSEEDDLLLLSGDMVKGGKQDRVLQATMILPPKSGKVPVRSFCVEQSRWRQRGGEDATQFSANRGVIAGAELKKAVQIAGSQSGVWQNVAIQQAGLSRNVGTVVNSTESPTSLQLALENEKLQAEVANFREAITKQVGDPAGVVGFVTVVNGRVTGAEAFGSHTLFKKAWSKAVNAAAVEAVAEKTDRRFTAMSAAGVRAFLESASKPGTKGSGTLSSEMVAEYRMVLGSVQPQTDLLPPVPLEAQVEATTSLDQPRRLGGAVGGFNPFNPPTGGSPVPTLPSTIDGQWSLRPDAGRLRQAPELLEKNTVVEYREKGNGAVIHKSFLPK